MALDIHGYQNKIVKNIEELVSTAGILNAELSDKVREIANQDPNLKGWAERMSTWRTVIYGCQDVDAIDRIYNEMAELIKGIMSENHEKEKQKIHEDANWWKEHYRKIGERENERKSWWDQYYAGESERQKNSQKRDEDNKRKLEESEKNRDEKHKKEFISEVEMELVKENISDEKFSKRVGVSDWRDKIRQADGFSAALSMKSNLIRITWKVKDEFTCANCGVKKEEYTAYHVGSKKCCSWDCEKALKGENKSPTKSNKRSSNNFGFQNIDEFFAWWKKMGITKIEWDFKNNKLVIECDNNRKLDLNQSGLNSKQQKELSETAKANSKPITLKEIKEINNNNERDGLKNNSSDRSAIIGGAIVVGIIFAAIIGIVVYASRRKD